MNPPPLERLSFFLGGRDLEMATIRELLQTHAARWFDRGLAWGASRAAYRDEIAAERAAGRTPVLIELTDDRLADAATVASKDAGDREEEVVVDHHGPLAGKHAPTALEQVFQLIGASPSEWTRWHALVAANDRGHVRGMRELGASVDEMIQVRAADRAAQGISEEEEAAGRAAAANAEQLGDGLLTVVRSPHGRTAPVCDALDAALGGPGYRNLLVVSPASTAFFGDGRVIEELSRRFPDSYYGGELPERGFWGRASAAEDADLAPQILATLSRATSAAELASRNTESRT